MIVRRDLIKTHSILPLIVLCLSATNIINHFGNLLSISVALSLVGLVGVYLFTIENDYYKQLIYAWLAAQILVITSTNHYGDKTEIWDLAQVFNISFYLTLNFSESSCSVGVNVLPILGFGLLKALEISTLTGKSLTFYQFREDNLLGEIFPIQGKILKRITIGDDVDWLHIQLEKSFAFEGAEINEVLIKRKDNEVIQINKDYQLVWFRLVTDPQKLTEPKLHKEEFPFIDWALCK
jgi:hypothetical protein